MTEDEAKTKWCPAFRGNDLGVNRPNAIGGEHGYCIASACMAWREIGEWRVRADKPWRSGRPLGEDVGPNNQTRSAGYCGLAGQPQ